MSQDIHEWAKRRNYRLPLKPINWRAWRSLPFMITWLILENILAFRVGLTHATFKVWLLISGILAVIVGIAYARIELDRVFSRYLYEPPTLADEVQYHVDQMQDDDPYVPGLGRNSERPPDLVEDFAADE